MCSRVAAMTTVGHNKSKQHSLNAKVSFSLVLPYTWLSLPSVKSWHSSKSFHTTFQTLYFELKIIFWGKFFMRVKHLLRLRKMELIFLWNGIFLLSTILRLRKKFGVENSFSSGTNFWGRKFFFSGVKTLWVGNFFWVEIFLGKETLFWFYVCTYYTHNDA